MVISSPLSFYFQSTKHFAWWKKSQLRYKIGIGYRSTGRPSLFKIYSFAACHMTPFEPLRTICTFVQIKHWVCYTSYTVSIIEGSVCACLLHEWLSRMVQDLGLVHTFSTFFEAGTAFIKIMWCSHPLI